MINRSGDSPGGRARAQARKVVWVQLIVTAMTSLGFGIFSEPIAGVSALAGGLINVVANLYFIRSWFTGYRVESPTQRALGFYVAEVAKLFITLALLVLAIGMFKLSFVPLFVTFVATLSVFWLALSPRFWNLVGGRS